MKSAFHSPPGPDTRDALTPPFTSQTASRRLTNTHMQWHSVAEKTHYVWKCTHTHTRCFIIRTFVINSHSRLMFTAYSLSKPQTVYFYCLKTASIHYPKIFFLRCLSFFRHAFRSPTNELNTEETWKRLDKAWLFEQRGDDILHYDYMLLYQLKGGRRAEETSQKVCSVSHPGLAVWLHLDARN